MQRGLSTQITDSVSWPSQARPPKAGDGLVHVRFRDLTAFFPHVSLQADHSDHFDHPPCLVQLTACRKTK